MKRPAASTSAKSAKSAKPKATVKRPSPSKASKASVVEKVKKPLIGNQVRGAPYTWQRYSAPLGTRGCLKTVPYAEKAPGKRGWRKDAEGGYET